MNVLRLPLKQSWYRMILIGDKKEYYLGFNSFWIKKLCNIEDARADIYECSPTFLQNEIKEGHIKYRPFTHIQFVPYSLDDAEDLTVEIEDISIGRCKSEWSTEGSSLYFIIKFKSAPEEDRIKLSLSYARFGDRFKNREGKIAIYQKTNGLLYKHWFITDTDYYPVANSGEADMKKINNPLDIIDICYEE